MAKKKKSVKTPASTATLQQSSRVRTPEDECHVQLSARDATQFLETMENPPAPNEAALRAARLYKDNYGKVVD